MKTPQKTQHKTAKETQKIEIDEKGREKMPNILSPEGIVVLFWAFFIDLNLVIANLLIFVFGIGVLYAFIVNIISLATLTLWLWVKTNHLIISKKMWYILKRRVPVLIASNIPIVSVFPIWTIVIFFELKK